MNDRRWAEKHVMLLGVFYIVYHSIGFALGLGIIVLTTALGSITGDPQATAIVATVGGIAGAMLMVIAIPGIVCGVGLVRGQSWARILTLIIGALDLLDIPVGTALGVYTFWVLMRDEAVEYLKC